MLSAVALTSAVGVLPVSPEDAELAATQAALHAKDAEWLKVAECRLDERREYGRFLQSIGGGTDEQLKGLARRQAEVDEANSVVNEVREKLKEVRKLRAKLRAGGEEEKRE